MKKTNQKLVREYGATYGPRLGKFIERDVSLLIVNTPKRTSVASSGEVLIRGRYLSQADGRVEVLVSMDPAALERKVALRSAQQGIEQATTPPAVDSLFGIL